MEQEENQEMLKKILARLFNRSAEPSETKYPESVVVGMSVEPLPAEWTDKQVLQYSLDLLEKARKIREGISENTPTP